MSEEEKKNRSNGHVNGSKYCDVIKGPDFSKFGDMTDIIKTNEALERKRRELLEKGLD